LRCFYRPCHIRSPYLILWVAYGYHSAAIERGNVSPGYADKGCFYAIATEPFGLLYTGGDNMHYIIYVDDYSFVQPFAWGLPYAEDMDSPMLLHLGYDGTDFCCANIYTDYGLGRFCLHILPSLRAASGFSTSRTGLPYEP
jgi:hypothetical protein